MSAFTCNPAPVATGRKPWQFYGRETEIDSLRAAFCSLEFRMVAVRGRRCVGKTSLLRKTVRGLPAGRPVLRVGAHPGDSPDDLQGRLQDVLRIVRARQPNMAPPVDDADASLRDLPQMLEHLLRQGVGVAIDDAQYLMSDKCHGLAREIAMIAGRLRQEQEAARDRLQPGGRHGGLVLAGGPTLMRMRDLVAALGPAVDVSLFLEPWSAAMLVSIARDRDWLGHPRRLALARAALGGMPGDWMRFAQSLAGDFAAWRDTPGTGATSSHNWRLAFAAHIVAGLPWSADSGFIPSEDLRVLEHVARSPEGEASASAIRAAFPDLAAPRLEAALRHLGGSLHMLHPVGAAGSGSRAAERWRIASPLLRFWVNAGMARLGHESTWRNRYQEEGCLADRMATMEQAALEELKRDCGDDWPDIPDPVPEGRPRLKPVMDLPRAPGFGSRPSPDPEVERRAFAFEVTAPGVLEGMLVPYGAPMRIGGAAGSRGFEEVFKPGALVVNGLLVAVQSSPAPASPPPRRKPLPRDRPLARPGLGLELRDGPGGMRAILTLPDTIDGRRVRARIKAGALTAFSTAFQAITEEWPAPDRRIVRQARLVGLALVDRPEHESLPA